MNKFTDQIEDTENRVESLSKIKRESDRTVTCLNKIVADHITARDNEIKKGKTLQNNINKLKRKLEKLRELE